MRISSGAGRVAASALILGVPALLAAACWHDPDETFAHHTLMEWVRADSAAETTRSFAAADDDPVVYVDASASMRGFADPAGRFEYSSALRALVSAAEQRGGGHTLQFRRVDAIVQPLAAAGQPLLAVSRSAGFYNGASSNIAGTIRSFSTARNQGGRGPSRTMIFVTDGVQSLDLGTPDPRCAAGADPRCVNAAISGLIGEGWGAHIFAVRSRFSGPVYSEARGGGSLGRYVAVDPATDARYRPFLIFVFTEAPAALEDLVDRIRAAMLQLEIRPTLIRELPLTLPLIKRSRLVLDTQGYSIADPFRAAEQRANPLVHHVEGPWRDDFSGGPLSDHVLVLEYAWDDVDFLLPCAVRVRAAVELSRAGQAFFGTAEPDRADLLESLRVREVARPADWYGPGRGLSWPPVGYQLKRPQFAPVLESAVTKPISYHEKAGANHAIGGHLVLTWSRSGDYLPLTLLRIDGSLDPAKIQLPRWIEDWSTDDDSRLGESNRLFNLDGLVRGLQHNERIARQGLDPWYLAIYPKKR